MFLFSSIKAIIKAGILKNDFMKNLEHAQIREIVSCMKPDNRKAGEWIIKEGDPGSTLFALQGTGCYVSIVLDLLFTRKGFYI